MDKAGLLKFFYPFGSSVLMRWLFIAFNSKLCLYGNSRFPFSQPKDLVYFSSVEVMGQIDFLKKKNYLSRNCYKFYAEELFNIYTSN